VYGGASIIIIRTNPQPRRDGRHHYLRAPTHTTRAVTVGDNLAALVLEPNLGLES